eukprot:1766401-Prorocentrum_lima.AAC.1
MMQAGKSAHTGAASVRLVSLSLPVRSGSTRADRDRASASYVSFRCRSLLRLRREFVQRV